MADTLRALTLGVAALHIGFAAHVVRWYARTDLLSAARTWHVVSVGLGWILAELMMVSEILLAWGQPFHILRTPLVLAANLFVFFGVQALYQRARALERRDA